LFQEVYLNRPAASERSSRGVQQSKPVLDYVGFGACQLMEYQTVSHKYIYKYKHRTTRTPSHGPESELRTLIHAIHDAVSSPDPSMTATRTHAIQYVYDAKLITHKSPPNGSLRPAAFFIAFFREGL
jgi:hypothetical protein